MTPWSIFTSDNGPSIESYLPNEPLRADFFDSFGPFDGIKRDCWEGGERVPALVRWPGHVPAGTVVTRPSISYDWLRTFADAAGLPAPARVDGVSLLPELTGQSGQRDRGYIYVEYFENGRTPKYNAFTPAHRNRKREQMQLIRIGDYAGVRYDIQSQADPFELYDVGADPKESQNLAAKMPGLEATDESARPASAPPESIRAASLRCRACSCRLPRHSDQRRRHGKRLKATTRGCRIWKSLQPVANGTADRP